MLAREIMSKNVEIGTPDMSLREAAQKMKSGDYGMLPIGENDRLVGSVTDRDITIRAVAEGKNVDSCKVRDIMSQGIHYCFEDEEVDSIANKFSKYQIRRLPVLNRDKRLVGILSLGDLSHSDADAQKVDKTLSKISEQGSQTSLQ